MHEKLFNGLNICLKERSTYDKENIDKVEIQNILNKIKHFAQPLFSNFLSDKYSIRNSYFSCLIS